MEHDLEDAARILFGTFSSEWLNDLVEQDNPESFLLKKTFFDGLTKETKELVSIIINLPEEFFLLHSGKLKKIVFEKYMIKNLHWERKKVKKGQKELQKYLLNML